MQAVLMRRKQELEAMLHRARGTNFENPDLTQASIGTVVTVRRNGSGEEETYTILGAWDSDPDLGIISYQTAIGQALLGHKIGDTVTLNDGQSDGQFTIVRIEPAPVDVMPAESASNGVLAETVAAD
jgi:transcription elongation GreA/GreB family factor